MKKKLLIFILLLCFFFVFILSENIYADTRVTVFISVSIVIGSAALFISLAFSDRFSRNKERSPDDDVVILSSADYLSPSWPQDKDDDLPDIGKIQILSW